MKTLLSIDWDYWCPEKPEYDFGHQESPLYIHHLWRGRAAQFLFRGIDYREAMPLEHDEGVPPLMVRKRMEELGWKFNLQAPPVVSESHVFAYEQVIGIGEPVTIVNLDAHHDIFYQDHASELSKEKHVLCGDWIGHLIDNGYPVDRLVQVYPLWRDTFPYNAEKVHEVQRDFLREHEVEFAVRYGFENVDPKEVTHLFICRSGAWTPPWLDLHFSRMVDAFCAGKRPKIIGPWKSRKDYIREWDDTLARQDADAMSQLMNASRKSMREQETSPCKS